MNDEVTTRYWNHNHPRAFENMEVLNLHREGYVLCPKCHGYGGWHLGHYPNTRDGWYPYFDTSCGQCNGWGYVDPSSEDAHCMHTWQELSNEESIQRGLRTGRCWHNMVCRSCNKVESVDTSD
jgi:hypothetical protein